MFFLFLFLFYLFYLYGTSSEFNINGIWLLGRGILYTKYHSVRYKGFYWGFQSAFFNHTRVMGYRAYVF